MSNDADESAADMLRKAEHTPSILVGAVAPDDINHQNMLFSADGVHWSNIATSSISKIEKLSKVQIGGQFYDLVRLHLKPAHDAHAATYSNLLRSVSFKTPNADIIWDPPVWNPPRRP